QTPIPSPKNFSLGRMGVCGELENLFFKVMYNFFCARDSRSGEIFSPNEEDKFLAKKVYK
ncbi:MAG: hypothetical protein R3Y11_10855, partial [Pseudomonadota bacterium]